MPKKLIYNVSKESMVLTLKKKGKKTNSKNLKVRREKSWITGNARSEHGQTDSDAGAKSRKQFQIKSPDFDQAKSRIDFY